MLNLYKIEGTENICEYDLNLSTYNSPNTWPTFQEDYEKFKSIIVNSVENKNSIVLLRIFDGELYFLEQQAVGNVQKRHISDFSKVNLKDFREGFLKADYDKTKKHCKILEY